MSTGKASPESRRLLSELTSLADKLQEIEAPENSRLQKQLPETLRVQADRLRLVADRLDPTLRPRSVFDPGDPQTSGRIIALTIIAQPRHQLSLVRPFYGAGVYALYYNGPFEPYSDLAGTEQPIYVGKADPKDANATDPIGQGKALYGRLHEHRKSITDSSTLDIDTFECRFLVVQSGFQKAAEEYLIRFFKPIWNNEFGICYGIGKHGDKSSTRGNKRSPWDTLHPGRGWADSIEEDQKPRARIVEEIHAHLTRYRPPASLDEITHAIMADLRQIGPTDFRTATGEQAQVETTRTETTASPTKPIEERLF